MTQANLARCLRIGLLAASCLTATPAMAQDASIENRLDRLESLVEGLIELMYAERILEDGRSGNLRRVQVSTRDNF